MVYHLNLPQLTRAGYWDRLRYGVVVVGSCRLNRALGLFVGFCLLLALVGAIVVWWLGPPLAKLALDGDRSKAPFFALFLQPAAAAPDSFQRQFLQRLVLPPQSEQPAPTNAGLSANLTWRSTNLSLVSGNIADEWGVALALEFATGRDFVRLVTSQDYRAIRASIPGARQLLVGMSRAPLQPFTQPGALLMLINTQDAAALGTWLAAATAVGGELIWDSESVVIEGAGDDLASWNRLLLLGFTDALALQSWAYSLDAQTANALLKAQSERLNLWVLQRPGG